MEEQLNFLPEGPYSFKNSKRFPDQYLEEFIFNNSEILFDLKNRTHRQEGDSLSQHIDFILGAGKHLESHVICPFCKENSVTHFLFVNYSFVSPNLTCCSNEDCKHQLRMGSGNSALKMLSISSLESFKKKDLRKKVEIMYRKIFNVKKNASPEEVFELFRAAHLKHVQKSLDIKDRERLNEVIAEENKKPLLLRFRGRRTTKKESQLSLF